MFPAKNAFCARPQKQRKENERKKRNQTKPPADTTCEKQAAPDKRSHEKPPLRRGAINVALPPGAHGKPPERNEAACYYEKKKHVDFQRIE